MNYVTARRKEELFRRSKRVKEEVIMRNKKKWEGKYDYKVDISRGIKGEFTLRKGEQVHTCSITGEDL